jgi:transcriptional regulator NrdR family protein
MRCQKCGKPSEVVKVYQFPTEARRRRECTKCGHRFTTSEKLWRKVYAEEMKPRPIRASHRPDKTEEPRRKIYSNFDVVALDGYDMDYEDVTTYVHWQDSD